MAFTAVELVAAVASVEVVLAGLAVDGVVAPGAEQQVLLCRPVDGLATGRRRILLVRVEVPDELHLRQVLPVHVQEDGERLLAVPAAGDQLLRGHRASVIGIGERGHGDKPYVGLGQAQWQAHVVLTDLEIEDDIGRLAAGVHDEDVASASAIERVGAGAAVEPVVAAGTEKDVLTGAAVENVIALAAVDDVISSATPDCVVAMIAVQRVSAAVAVDRVVAIAAVDDVAVAAAGDHVIAAPAVDGVVPFGAVDLVVALGAEEGAALYGVNLRCDLVNGALDRARIGDVERASVIDLRDHGAAVEDEAETAVPPRSPGMVDHVNGLLQGMAGQAGHADDVLVRVEIRDMDIGVTVQLERVVALAAPHDVAAGDVAMGVPYQLRADARALAVVAGRPVHAARDQRVVAVAAVHQVVVRVLEIADQDVVPAFALENVCPLAAGEEIAALTALDGVLGAAVGAALVPVAPVAAVEPVVAGSADDFHQPVVTVRGRVAAVSVLARMVNDLARRL